MAEGAETAKSLTTEMLQMGLEEKKNFQQADFNLKQGKLSDYELPKDGVETELPSLPRKYASEEIGCET